MVGHPERTVFPVSALFSIIMAEAPPEPSTAIELVVWKWVVIIGVAAVVIFYAIKRVSEVVVRRKTATMIKEVVGDEGGGDGTEAEGG